MLSKQIFFMRLALDFFSQGFAEPERCTVLDGQVQQR
jgi:hypothetical protein